MSALSEILVCNRGLQKVGENQIMSFDDPTKQARECKRLYSFARDTLQRLYLWNFTKKRAVLAALSDAPNTPEYDRQFSLPDDFIRLIDVQADEEWSLEGNRILTNAQAPLYIIYSARITDTTQFDTLFTETLSAYIAVELSEIFTQDRFKKQSLFDQFNLLLTQAKATDAKEQHPLMLDESEWITSRW
jgi:hypothetical protein